MCSESKHKYLSESFSLTHLNYEILKEMLPNIRKDIYDIRVKGSNKEDNELNRLAIRLGILRVALLKKYGGIWLDSDVVVLKNFHQSISKLLRAYGFIGSWDGSGHICNSIMCAKKNSVFISDYWDTINERLNESTELYWGEIGAYALTSLYKQNVNKYHNIVHIYNNKVFHPISFQNRKILYGTKPLHKIVNNFTMGCVLFNNVTPEWFKVMPRNQILRGKMLISALFRRALIDN